MNTDHDNSEKNGGAAGNRRLRGRGRKKPEFSLTKKFIFGILSFTLLLFNIVSLIVTYDLAKRVEYEYSYYGFAATQSLASFFEGDRIAAYLDTRNTDSYYEEFRELCRTVKDEYGAAYCYIYIPQEDGIVYIMDSEEANCIGEPDVYTNGGKEMSEKAFSKSPEQLFTLNSSDEYGFLLTACSPIYDSSGEPVALLALDMTMDGMIDEMADTVIGTLLSLTFFMLVCVGVFFIFAQRKLIHPIRQLTNAADLMIDNLEKDVGYEADIYTGDEIQELAESFEKMDTELREYIKENSRITAEKERLGAELDMARNIQASQLPNVFPPFPDRGEFDIYASMTPAKEVGGDFYDFFFIDDDHLGIVIADVSGKGVPAALFMMISKMLIHNYAMLGQSPAEVLENANAAICENNTERMFVTVWFGILELSTGKVVSGNAGHEYPVIRQPDGSFELIKDKHDFVLGGIKKKKYREQEFTLGRGGTLFVYTDGVPEATDANEELFGTARLIEALNADSGASPEQLLKNVHTAVNDFVGDAPQFDDLTMLAVRLN